MAAEHAKEACFFLLDVTEMMGPHLADAKTVLKGLLTHKVLFAKQDVVGIGLVGTEGTTKRGCRHLVPSAASPLPPTVGSCGLHI